MNLSRGNLFAVLVLVLALSVPGLAQTTSTITGRAMDSSGALIPGVEVSVASPALIGGSRMAITNESGSYRFTQLAFGEYTVTFSLPGFKTLNIEGVRVQLGATATVNGELEVATVAETITVLSQEPTIDLEQALVAVNFSTQEFEELPYSRSLRGVMMMMPGVFATSYDIGGSSFGTGSSPGGQAFGKSGDAQVVIDGMVWDQHYEDYGAFEEVQVATAAKSAEQSAAGTSLTFVVKSGGNDFHGQLAAEWSDSSFQSKNIDQDLLDRGFSPSPNAFTKYTDYYGEIGGPLVKDKFWFYFTDRHGYGGRLIPGFIDNRDGQDAETGPPAEFYTILRDPTIKLTWQLTDNNKLETMVQFGRKWQPYRGGSRTRPLLSTQNQDSWSAVGPMLKWTYIASPTTTLDVQVSRGGYWWPSIPWTSDVSIQDRNSGEIRGGYLETNRRPVRWQWNFNFSKFGDLGSTSHELKTGYHGTWGYSSATDQVGYRNQQFYRYRSTDAEEAMGMFFLNPDDVRIYDYPNFSKNGESYDSWFLNDKVTINQNLTISFGVRWDRYTSWLPEQGNSGVGPFATARIFPAQGPDQFPVYNSIVPRVSFVYDITGEGRVALKASYGQYAGSDSGGGQSPGRTASSANPSGTTTWTYTWDGTIPFVPNNGPDGIFGNADDPEFEAQSGGAGNVTRSFANDLGAAWTEEFTVGVDLGISRDYSFRFNTVRKVDYNNQKTISDNLPFSAYTDVRYGPDPGRDNIAGTADDGTVETWSVPRSHPFFGDQFTTYVQSGPNEGNDHYHGYEFTLNKQFSDGWSFMVSLGTNLRKIRANNPTNPNSLLYNYANQNNEWNKSVKINAVYELPFGLQYSTSILGQSENWVWREVRLRNALRSTQTIIPERQVSRLPFVTIWDQRVSKEFQVNDRHTIEANLDLFNSMNSNLVTRIRERHGSRYLEPERILPPRIMRLSVKWKF